jgi:hypothetical protein
MAIGEGTIEENSAKYTILMAENQTLTEALQRLFDNNKYPENDTYLVVTLPNAQYKVILFSDLNFDYHRGLVLEAFNLKMPDNLSEEQVIWVKLATFIRRGDVFYFPEKYRKTETKNDEAKEKKNTNE